MCGGVWEGNDKRQSPGTRWAIVVCSGGTAASGSFAFALKMADRRSRVAVQAQERQTVMERGDFEELDAHRNGTLR